MPDNASFDSSAGYGNLPQSSSSGDESSRLAIQILQPDGIVHDYPLIYEITTIGSGEDNSVTIRDPAIQRYHVEIRVAAGKVILIDLDTKSGTYLGTERLKPNEMKAWPPQQVVRIGPYFLRLKGNILQRSAASPPVPSQKADPPAEETPSIALFSDNRNITVSPGSTEYAQFVVVNNSDFGDQFSLRIEGVTHEWIGLPAPLGLSPGSQSEATIQFRIPAVPEGRAGTYPLRVSAVGREHRMRSTARELILTVLEMPDFTSTLAKFDVDMQDEVEVVVENTGNTQQNIEIECHDVKDRLLFYPSLEHLTLEPGKGETVRFQAGWRNRPLIGGFRRVFPIKVTVSAGVMKSQEHQGEISTRGGCLPVWIFALPFLFLLCATISLLALNRIGGGVGNLLAAPFRILEGAPTAELMPDDLSIQATQNARAYETASAEETQEASLNAAATESWLDQDEDRDGLSNRQELRLNTLLDKRDTDEDGIDDGDEVYKWLTDPLRRDTDLDGWADGEEIARGIDPLSPDTDGDGTPDPADTVPGLAATPTPDATMTARAVEWATAQAGCYVKTGNDTLNLRAGPGTVYEPPIAKLPNGMRLRPIAYRAQGIPDGQWIEVEVRRTSWRGWVSLRWVECNMTVVDLPPGQFPPPPTDTPTAVPTEAATAIPTGTLTDAPTATTTAESTPTPDGGTLPPLPTSSSLNTLDDIYPVIKIQGLNLDKSVYAAGDIVEMYYELQNRSATTVEVPPAEPSTQRLIGIRQHWVERLEDDTTIPGFTDETARDGARYRFGNSIIEAPILLPGEVVTTTRELVTTNYPPGAYRITIQYLTLDGQLVLDSATVEFEIQ